MLLSHVTRITAVVCSRVGLDLALLVFFLCHPQHVGLISWVVLRPLLQLQESCPYTTQGGAGRKMAGVKTGPLPLVALFYQGTNS